MQLLWLKPLFSLAAGLSSILAITNVYGSGSTINMQSQICTPSYLSFADSIGHSYDEIILDLIDTGKSNDPETNIYYVTRDIQQSSAALKRFGQACHAGTVNLELAFEFTSSFFAVSRNTLLIPSDRDIALVIGIELNALLNRQFR